MRARQLRVLLLTALLGGCDPAEPTSQAVTPPGPDTEAGRPVADAADLPPPSGDPHDDAPSVDVPAGPTPLLRQAGTFVHLTAAGQPWPVDSVLAQSGPGLLGDYEEVTLRLRAGTPVQERIFSELTLRLPFTPDLVAHVPVAIPLGEGLRAEWLTWQRRTGRGAPYYDAAARQAAQQSEFDEVLMGAPQGTFTLQTLDRAGRVLSGQLDVTFTANPDGPNPRPVRLQGSLREVRY